jgi:crotonobetainyl-CoA:carnitine CoA-transferase CaiB-like acyl-CoA transferase
MDERPLIAAPPLRGVRVVELAEGIAAPYATQILAHLGAEVIKVERPEGDWLRSTARASFLVVNKAKRCIGLDAKTEGGAGALWSLIESADVLVTNFRRSSLARLSLHPDEIARRVPRLVLAELTAYAMAGPTAGRGGTDTILQAVSGLMDQVGSSDGEPTRVGFPLVDLVAARDLAIGVLAALLERQLQASPGRRVQVSLFSSASSLLLEGWQNTLLGRMHVPRTGNLNAVHAPGGVYECADGTRLALITLRDDHWRRLCAVIGRADLAAEASLSTNDDRVARRDEVEGHVQAGLRHRPAGAWQSLFGEAGVLCGVVSSIDSIRSDPELYPLVPLVETVAPGGAKSIALGVPITIGGLPPEVPATAELGQHTREVLAEIGLSTQAIDALVSGGGAVDPAQRAAASIR